MPCPVDGRRDGWRIQPEEVQCPVAAQAGTAGGSARSPLMGLLSIRWCCLRSANTWAQKSGVGWNLLIISRIFFCPSGADQGCHAGQQQTGQQPLIKNLDLMLKRS